MDISQVKFKPIQNTDIDNLCHLLWEPDVKKYLCDDQLLPRETIQTFIDQSQTDENSRLLVISHQDNWLGFVGLRPIEPIVKKQLSQKQPVEITIALRKKYTGKNIAQLAVKQIQKYAAEILKQNTIFAIIDAPNTKSRHLFQNLNYTELSKLNIEGHPQVLYQLPLNTIT